MKRILTLMALFICINSAISVGRSSADVINAQGSDTTIGLLRKLAEGFHAETGNVVNIQGGGTGAGIQACIAEMVPMTFTTRKMKDEEVSQGMQGVAYAMDGLAVIVHKANPQNDIGMGDLKGIYSGTKTSWGNGNSIVIFDLPPRLAARRLFKSKVLGAIDMTSNISVKHPGVMLSSVSKIPNAIGYLATGEALGKLEVKTVSIDGVIASDETIKDGSYPMVRILYLATKGEPASAVQQFIDFVLGEKGQLIVKAQGYVPIQ